MGEPLAVFFFSSSFCFCLSFDLNSNYDKKSTNWRFFSTNKLKLCHFGVWLLKILLFSVFIFVQVECPHNECIITTYLQFKPCDFSRIHSTNSQYWNQISIFSVYYVTLPIIVAWLLFFHQTKKYLYTFKLNIIHFIGHVCNLFDLIAYCVICMNLSWRKRRRKKRLCQQIFFLLIY